jgi:DNA polymerase-3 subunit delta'
VTFAGIEGQDIAISTLRRALRAGRLHHAYRFEGPEGVGKERVALALGQALLCEKPVDGEGCGSCSSCRRVVTFSKAEPHVPVHPDIILLEKGLYPPSVLGQSTEEKQNLSIAQVRSVLLTRLRYAPHEGRGRLVIIRRPEELHPGAANALLKTLEEPPARTHFVLLTSRGRMLLDTIRSRALAVRFAPLGDAILHRILEKKGIPAELRQGAIDLAAGSASAALEAADQEATKERSLFVEGVQHALAAPSMAEGYDVAQARDKDKDGLRDKLTALGATLAREARARALTGGDAGDAPEQVTAVFQALRELDRNISPALILETMMVKMRQGAG